MDLEIIKRDDYYIIKWWILFIGSCIIIRPPPPKKKTKTKNLNQPITYQLIEILYTVYIYSFVSFLKPGVNLKDGLKVDS